MLINKSHSDLINSPVRRLNAKAEMYQGSALVNTFSPTDRLISFKVDRVGEKKFFGFGICQKINIKLIDLKRELNITTENSFKIKFEVGGNKISSLPTFFVTEVHRDEKTNQLSITAYDKIYKSKNHTSGEIEITSYTLKEYAAACATKIGASALKTFNINDSSFDISFPEGANLEGTEDLREVLNDIAEATQSIYYLDNTDALVFKRLKSSGIADLTIDKARYIELKSRTNRRLTKLVSATELGDDITTELAESGTTQYIRNNAFWDLREDRATLLDNALAAVGGLTINQFDCKWRGNYLLELGDMIELITKDNKSMYSFLLDDILEFNGGLTQNSQWSFEDNDNEHSENPTSLGEVLNQTSAKVDKVNKEITMVVKEADANKQSISQLQLDTNGINATVSDMQKNVKEGFENTGSQMADITKTVNAKLDSEGLDLKVGKIIDEHGVNKVETETGFKFDESGLNISKKDSEMTTLIDNDGMKVSKNNTTVLTANNQGVDAINLHATTYLIIGNNSRLEDYNSNETACFWIGG